MKKFQEMIGAKLQGKSSKIVVVLYKNIRDDMVTKNKKPKK